MNNTIPKTPAEFNEKFKDYLEEGHYGMAFYSKAVIKYMDEEFTKEIAINPDYSFSQIKSKWSNTRIYAETLDPNKTKEWEAAIDRILGD